MPSAVPYVPVPQAMFSPTSGLFRKRRMRLSNVSLGELCSKYPRASMSEECVARRTAKRRVLVRRAQPVLVADVVQEHERPGPRCCRCRRPSRRRLADRRDAHQRDQEEQASSEGSSAYQLHRGTAASRQIRAIHPIASSKTRMPLCQRYSAWSQAVER